MTGRLPALRPAELDPAQPACFMAAGQVPWTETGGAGAIAADGRILGPFNPLLVRPALGAALLGVFRADENGADPEGAR